MTERHNPYLNVTIPCPYCADGFVTAGDRHARTKQDVCRHCAGTGFSPANTGQTAATSAQPPSPRRAGDRDVEAAARDLMDRFPTVTEVLHAAEKRAQLFYDLPEPAFRFAMATWGQAWCENEAGSLAEFARLAARGFRQEESDHDQ